MTIAPPDPATLTPAPTPPARAHFRSELQGLRAVAVGLVVVYHVWFGRVSGGVDVFFLITGFLLIGRLADAAAVGPLPLRRMWLRNAMRLLPAATTVLLATLVAATVLLPGGRLPQAVREIVASLLFMENWQLAADAVDYAARNNTSSVVAHFWSLSIQGQVLVVFPLLVALLARTGRGPRLRVRLAVALTALTVASLVFSVALTANDQPLAYFHSLTRLWEFGLGGLLALVIDRLAVPRRLRTALGWIGVVGLLACGAVLQVGAVFPGYVALWPVLRRPGADRRDHRLTVGRGPPAPHPSPAAPRRPQLPAVSVALADPDLHPAPPRPPADRDRGRPRGDRRVAGAVRRHPPSRGATLRRPDRPGGAAHRAGHRRRLVRARRRLGRATRAGRHPPSRRARPGGRRRPRPGRAGDPVDAQRVRGLGAHRLLGLRADGVACQAGVQRTGERAAGQTDRRRGRLARAAVRRCSRTRGPPARLAADLDRSRRLPVLGHRRRGGRGPHLCELERGRDRREATLRPDAVVTMATRDVRRGLSEEVPRGFVVQWQRLEQLGIPVLAVRDNPRFAFSPPDCVARRGREHPSCGVARESVYGPVPPWTYVDIPSNVSFLDTADLLCDPLRCPAEVGNVLVYMDDNHLSAAFAATLAPLIDQQVRDAFGW